MRKFIKKSTEISRMYSRSDGIINGKMIVTIEYSTNSDTADISNDEIQEKLQKLLGNEIVFK